MMPKTTSVLTASDLTANSQSVCTHLPSVKARWRSGYAPDCKSKADATESNGFRDIPGLFHAPFTVGDSGQLLTESGPDFLDGQPRIYFIGTRLRRGDRVKVGISTNVPQRLARLQSGSPVELTVFATFPGSYALEKRVHHNWRKFRCHGEWFRLTDGMCRTIAGMVTR